MRKYCLSVAALLVCIALTAQNKHEEIIPYEEIDGFIVIPAQIKGKEFKFIFDPMAQPAILEEYAAETGFLRNDIPVPFAREEIESVSGGSMVELCIGLSIFVRKTGGIIIKNDYLKSNGIAGVLNAAPFAGQVLTINSKKKTITISAPYKPGYMSLRNQTSLGKKAQSVSIDINGQNINANLDLAGRRQIITLSETDFASLQHGFGQVVTGVQVTETSAYRPTDTTAGEAVAPKVTIANVDMQDIKISALKGDKVSAIGAGILEIGIVSIDYAKGRMFFQPFDSIDESKIPDANSVGAGFAVNTENIGSNIIHLTRLNFAELVFDYRTKTEWQYAGNKPAVIDFWAPWCGPCKRIGATLEKLAAQYKEEIVVYKLNIDDEPELAKYFDAKAIPLLLYIPMEGQPIRGIGALPEEAIVDKINQILVRPIP